MADENVALKKIFKSTSIIGGVQFFIIIISIIRSKYVAVLLGPTGIGITGMFISSLGVITSLTNLGLGVSAIREISLAFESGNKSKLAIIIKVVKKWVWLTGILGLIFTVLFASMISSVTFGNNKYTWSFIFLGITILFGQLNSSQLLILQGTRNIKFLAKSNFLGSLISLFTTLPLYYFFGLNGIVPAIIVSSFVPFILSNYYSKKIYIDEIDVSNIRTFAIGKKMLSTGLLFSVSSFITISFSHLLRVFLSKNGNLYDVGLYNSGVTIITTYVGIIFSAMGNDYFPRLAAVSNDLEKSNKTINHQIEISLIILGPVIIGFILFIELVIGMLYTDQFLEVSDMIVLSAFGVFFKTGSYIIGYNFLAKGASKLFIFSEMAFNLYFLAFSILGYSYCGLIGLGISYIISYLISMVKVYLINKYFLNFEIDKSVLIILCSQVIFGIFGMIIYFNFEGINFILTSASLFILSCSYSYFFINKYFGSSIKNWRVLLLLINSRN
jgi:O-antigen/teichoic acid export membrane protein